MYIRKFKTFDLLNEIRSFNLNNLKTTAFKEKSSLPTSEWINDKCKRISPTCFFKDGCYHYGSTKYKSTLSVKAIQNIHLQKSHEFLIRMYYSDWSYEDMIKDRDENIVAIIEFNYVCLLSQWDKFKEQKRADITQQ